MSQSLTKLKSIYLTSNYGRDQKHMKTKHMKSLSQVPTKNLLKPNYVEKLENFTVVTGSEKLKIKIEDDYVKLDHIGARSTLARTGLMALQQRMIELEYIKALKTQRNSVLDEKNKRMIEDERKEKFYEKFQSEPVIRNVKF